MHQYTIDNGNLIGNFEGLYKDFKDPFLQTKKEKFETIYDSEKFEESWTEICKELKVSPEPRLNSNQSDKEYNKIVKLQDLSDNFKNWHRAYNEYDYKLYEEFCA